MEPYKKVMIVGLLFVICMIGSEPMLANGQSICNMPPNGLKACLPSVSGDNPVDPPYPACCAALAVADLKCFCRYKNSGMLSIYGIDPNKAMALPGKCKVGDSSWHC